MDQLPVDVEPPVDDKPPAMPQVPQFSDLVRAAQFGRYEECRQYLEPNLFDVNQRDSENVTLLHWAAINNQTSIVDYFLSKGADINAIGGDLKSTPLQWAIRQGHLSMVVLLLKRGSDLTIMDDEGCNALHLAAQFGHTPIVGYLVAKGMDIDQPDTNGMTALMWSAYRVSKVDPTRLLLTFGSSLRAADYRHKNTALHWAVSAKNLTSITLLLDAGADVEIPNANGESPLDIARKHQSPWLVEMLEAHMVKPSSQDDLLKKISRNKHFCGIIRNMAPFLGYFLIAFILDCGASVLVKTISFILMVLLLVLFSSLVHQSCHNTNLPVAIYLAITFWLYYTMFYFLTPCKLIKCSQTYLDAQRARCLTQFYPLNQIFTIVLYCLHLSLYLQQCKPIHIINVG